MTYIIVTNGVITTVEDRKGTPLTDHLPAFLALMGEGASCAMSVSEAKAQFKLMPLSILTADARFHLLRIAKHL